MSFVARNHPQQLARRGPLDPFDNRRTDAATFTECRVLAGVGDFDLDPAATAKSARAPAYFTIDDDRPWHGRVWVNPPYSDIRRWVRKAWWEWRHRDGVEMIAKLLPANRTEQAWWQELVEPHRRRGELAVYFLAGRRRSDRPGWTTPAKGDRPLIGLCLVVWAAP